MGTRDGAAAGRETEGAPGQGGIDAPRVCGERERDEAGNVGGRKRGNGS